ncbi:hypothetical protein [Mangrovicoccus sp. HB161399]|uniref:hypothetical protein n=1 Tax=Mangrovicoccus sp. HB161399 TaxID=2720392 RepID=UPI001554B491|nr:hypothetical protein [Mangrovicoccus sp. HB161399]
MARRKKGDLISGIMANAVGKSGADDDPSMLLSIRPGDKISALLDLVSRLTSKSPAEYASDGLSESLFLYLVSSDRALDLAAEQIRKILAEGGQLQRGSALDLLVERGVIEIKD